MDETPGAREMRALLAENARLVAENARLVADNRGLRQAAAGLGRALCRAAEVSYGREEDLAEAGIDLGIGEDGGDHGVLERLRRKVAEVDREVAGRDA